MEGRRAQRRGGLVAVAPRDGARARAARRGVARARGVGVRMGAGAAEGDGRAVGAAAHVEEGGDIVGAVITAVGEGGVGGGRRRRCAEGVI